MICEQYIIEIKTNKFSIGTGKVVLVTLIASLAKLKFRREESISLFLMGQVWPVRLLPKAC